MTDCVVDILHRDLNVRLRKVLSNLRSSLCNYYEHNEIGNTQRKLIWSDLNDDRLAILCGLSGENLTEVLIQQELLLVFFFLCVKFHKGTDPTRTSFGFKVTYLFFLVCIHTD